MLEPRSEAADSTATGRDWPRLLPWLLVLVGVLAYFNTLPNAFVFDTRRVIDEGSIDTVLSEPARLLTTQRPLVTLSFGLNHALNRAIALPGSHSAGYHLFNLLIHVAAGMALYGLVRRTLRFVRWPRENHDTVAPWLASVAALLWLVHPLNTQAVSYVVQRSESMMGLFLLLTLYALVRYAETPRQRGWAVACVAAGWAGLGCKEVAAVIPAVAILLDRTLLTGSFKETLRRRWPVYIGLFASWLAIPLILPRMFNSSNSVGFMMEDLTPLAYLLSQGGVILHYLRLSFWPHPLVIDYWWLVSYPDGQWLPGVIVVGALLAVTAWGVWRNAWWGMLGAAFFFVLAPTSSFVPVADLAMEHRMYVPLIAVVTLVVMLGYAGLRRIAPTHSAQAVIAGLVVGVLGMSLVAGTVARNEEYYRPTALWKTVIERVPHNPRANQKLGEAYQRLIGEVSRRGTIEESIALLERAAEEYRKAIDKHQHLVQQGRRRPPAWHLAHANLGNILNDLASQYQAQGFGKQAQQLMAEAEHHLRATVQAVPEDPAGHYDLGRVLMRRGNPAGAAEAMTRAINLQPRFVAAYHGLAAVRAHQGHLDEAVRLLREAVQREPGFAAAHADLGKLLLQQGENEQAIEALEMAQHAGHRDPALPINLATAHTRRNELREARRTLWHAIENNPTHIQAHLMFAQLSERVNDARRARHSYENALHINPGLREAAVPLALLLTTHPDESFRDPARAAALLMPYQDDQPTPALLEALAALHAEQGDTTRAASEQQRAITLATEADASSSRIEQMQQRLAAYETGKPYRHEAYADNERDRHRRFWDGW